ncbi:MAG: aryl-sulfate sulfotransferase [Acidobacteriaceae bacterium]
MRWGCVPLLFLGLAGWMAGCVTGCGSSGPMTTTSVPTPPSSAPPTQPPPVPQQVGSVTISPQNAALAPGQTMQFTAASTGGGAIAWSVNGVAGGNATVGTIDTKGNYTAPAIAQSTNAVVQAALASAPQANYATATVALVQPGQVLQTANPQVALYSIYLPQPGTATIQFGPDTGYGLETWAQPSPATPNNYGGQVNIEVAGMRASTQYHMRALVTLASGTTFTDSDHTFTTGAAPPTAPVQITTPSGQTPQPGIELYDTMQFGTTPYSPSLAQAFATDLQGNVIWTYSYAGSPVNVIFPIKLLPNGHFLINLGITSGAPPGSQLPAGTIDDVREIDLAGNIIHDLPMATLNQSLAANGFTGLNLFAFSHDILALPNGHYVLLANMTKQYTNLPGYPGTTNVIGDVLVDVDQNYNPDWVWNTFDHLDINRHPFQFPPDWTHSDALLYSAEDHNLLLSVRNQNWIIKIDFEDGKGTGNILWRLGEGGDFKLVNGVDPTDWFYAQHGMNFFGPNTSGVFDLGIMDDGDDREFPPGVTCGAAGAPVCKYSTVPVLQVDETAMTATLLSLYTAPASLYTFFGGQADLLANGDIEADFCAAKSGATVQEYQPSSSIPQTSPQIVWQSVSPGYDQYRALRLPSLYPGVQW